MLFHKINELLGRMAESPAVSADSGRNIDIVETEAPPGLAVVILDVLVCGSLCTVALEDIFLTEVGLCAEQVSNVRYKVILFGRNDACQRRDGLLDILDIIILSAIPESRLSIECLRGS